MTKLLRNCTLIPIPKPGKDPSRSDNYRPITLAPNLSKVLEWSILLQFATTFSGESGGSQEIATPEYCIKLHVLTAFLIDLYI